MPVTTYPIQEPKATEFITTYKYLVKLKDTTKQNDRYICNYKGEEKVCCEQVVAFHSSEPLNHGQILAMFGEGQVETVVAG